MNTPFLPPAVLMRLLAAAQPPLADSMHDHAASLCEHRSHGEAFKSYAALAQQDDRGAPYKLATLYYTAQDDVRAAFWFLITGARLPDNDDWAAAA